LQSASSDHDGNGCGGIERIAARVVGVADPGVVLADVAVVARLLPVAAEQLLAERYADGLRISLPSTSAGVLVGDNDYTLNNIVFINSA
jgi:hypothetical protein